MVATKSEISISVRTAKSVQDVSEIDHVIGCLEKVGSFAEWLQVRESSRETHWNTFIHEAIGDA